MERVEFWLPKGKYGFLCNFYKAPTIIDGKEYKTNEHFFQSQKFVGKIQEQYIMDLETARQSAREGKRRDFPLRKDWDEVKEDIMYKGLMAKFEQHPLLKKKLLETAGKSLFEVSPYDDYWGTYKDNTGKNRLGILLERVREELLIKEKTKEQ